MKGPVRVEESEYNGVRTRLYIFEDCIVELSGVEDQTEEEIEGRLQEALQNLQESRATEEPAGGGDGG